MSKSRIGYRKLNIYKYQLMEAYSVKIGVTGKNISTPFIDLDAEGKLTIKKGYAWDGPSGPTFDTKSFMRGSLVHDALYQLLRGRHLEQELRKFADDLMKKMCREDGMFFIRAWYTHLGVRFFGGKHAKPPQEEDTTKIIWVP